MNTDFSTAVGLFFLLAWWLGDDITVGIIEAIRSVP